MVREETSFPECQNDFTTIIVSVILTMGVTSPTKNVNHIPCCDLVGAATTVAARISECTVTFVTRPFTASTQISA